MNDKMTRNCVNRIIRKSANEQKYCFTVKLCTVDKLKICHTAIVEITTRQFGGCRKLSFSPENLSKSLEFLKVIWSNFIFIINSHSPSVSF